MLLNLLYYTVSVIAILFVLWRLFLLAIGYWLYSDLKKQGVPFLCGFNYFTDFIHLIKMRQKTQTTWDISGYNREILKVDKLPSMLGVCYFGLPTVYINSASCLKDIYINKNMYQTKDRPGAAVWQQTMLRSILFAHT